MFLMHGRRFNEVVTLKWEDIDFTNSTYTIKALNNKARVDMTYHLSNRLKEVLTTLGIKDDGYVRYYVINLYILCHLWHNIYIRRSCYETLRINRKNNC